MEPNDIVVLGITGGLSLFFIVSGIRGLVQRQITVVNPNSLSAWPEFLGALLFIPRRSMGLDNNLQSNNHTARIHGSSAQGRAWFYILLGIACGLAAALHFINVR
jgi:hypothetical protein